MASVLRCPSCRSMDLSLRMLKSHYSIFDGDRWFKVSDERDLDLHYVEQQRLIRSDYSKLECRSCGRGWRTKSNKVYELKENGQ